MASPSRAGVQNLDLNNVSGSVQVLACVSNSWKRYADQHTETYSHAYSEMFLERGSSEAKREQERRPDPLLVEVELSESAIRQSTT